MKIFSAVDYPQGSPAWHELRRGRVTASGADRILTPKTLKPSAQAKGYIAELIGDTVNQSPNWFTENHYKPPNQAIVEGQAREQESRDWFALDRDVEVACVGFCLGDCGRSGFSPDGLINPIRDARGNVIGAKEGLELKNPMASTHAGYLLDGELPPEYKCQVHFQLLIGGFDRVWFVSYHHSYPKQLVIPVERDSFTDALAAALEAFHQQYAEAKRRLGIPEKLAEEETING